MTARKVGGLLSSAGKLRVQDGKLEVKGLLRIKQLGEVRNLQAVKVSSSLFGSSTDLVFGNADEGRWTLQDQGSSVPLFQSLEDQLGRKFLELPEGFRRKTSIGAGRGFLIILATLFGLFLMGRLFSVSDSSGRMVLPRNVLAPPPVVTKAEFDQIADGMSYEQVTGVIGASGEVLSSGDIAGFKTVMYSWMNSNGSGMNAMFQNGRLITKAQFGLP